MSMRADFLVLLGTIGLFTLGNPTTRILASSRRSNPSPRGTVKILSQIDLAVSGPVLF